MRMFHKLCWSPNYGSIHLNLRLRLYDLREEVNYCMNVSFCRCNCLFSPRQRKIDIQHQSDHWLVHTPMKFKIALFTVFLFFGFKASFAQYTYPIYGGLFITGAVNIVSIHSANSQSVRITNYNDYDTTINLTANKSVDLMMYKKFFTISVGSRNTILKRMWIQQSIVD